MSEGVMSFREVFDEIANDTHPAPEVVHKALESILAGEWTPVQIAGFVVALRLRGEDAATITTAAQTIGAHMIVVDHGLPLVADTCGTGGDGQGTLNLSTAAAFVVAACGIPVAKHGNRSVSSRSGSADVLEALGIPIDVRPDKQAGVLQAAGIAFLFGPAHHPALRHCQTARRELAVRTIFNAIGPLVNPARATHRLLGTYDHALRQTMAQVLTKLGVRRAWVVCGDDGLDEVSPFGTTQVTEMADGQTRERLVHPETFGLEPSRAGAIAGGSAAENAHAIRRILEGKPHAARMAVILNAAAALAVCREVDDETRLPDLAKEATEALDSQRALRKLEMLRLTTTLRSAA
ncbi:MAG TPA: anthranilate phosphoribosyltransferase [Polyangium sp.]|nr:anthranilate phosphoribosyltransferase [Polyangium sp.]